MAREVLGSKGKLRVFFDYWCYYSFFSLATVLPLVFGNPRVEDACIFVRFVWVFGFYYSQ